MKKIEWYFEYELIHDRPGLLGEIASLLGMLSINIMMINGIEDRRRVMLLLAEETSIKRLKSILEMVHTIQVINIKKPNLRDRLAVRHGTFISRDQDNRKIVRFTRSELGLLVDFMAELYKEDKHKLIGVRGMPRVGKTESIVAASVSANKRWVFVSSTLLKQTIRKSLLPGEYDHQNIYIIDGVVSMKRADEEHWQLIREIMSLPAVKVVEHPDIFVKGTKYTLDDFDYIIELRTYAEEKITYELLEQKDLF